MLFEFKKYGLNELITLSAINGKASQHLAKIYELGEAGLRPNLPKAIEFYEKSSLQNNDDATYYLAELYANGKPGVTIDMPKAVEFFKKSAQLNHAQASFWLAHYYQSLTDQSVENKIAAFNYFLQSAQNGNEAALPALERLGSHMNTQQQTAISQLYGSLFYNPERSAYWSARNQATQSKNIQLTSA